MNIVSIILHFAMGSQKRKKLHIESYRHEAFSVLSL